MLSPLLFSPSLLARTPGYALRRSDDISGPQFFLMITVPNPAGLDFTYLFDSRPLEMTANKMLQNYREDGEPTPITGPDGNGALATSLVSNLMPLRQYFSVINGVHMSALDGHDQNANYLYAGNTFGGESFIPHLNRAHHERPLDLLQRGRVRAETQNAERSVPLGPKAAAALVKRLKSMPPLDPQSEFFQQLMARFKDAATIDSQAAFSIGAQLMQMGLGAAPELTAMIEKIEIKEDDTDSNFISMLGEFFKNGAVRSAILSLNIEDGDQSAIFDTHDPAGARKQPEIYKKLADAIAEVINGLRATPFDEKRSLLDVTTFMFSAEFSRTMRQLGRDIEDTGTNHNQHCNSLLLGGAGVNGGHIVGASDFQISTETLSEAHRSLDPNHTKIFGRPFDFKTRKPRTDLPQVYKAADYLNVNSVVNTVYKIFDVPETKWRIIERNGDKSPVLQNLIKA